MGGRQQDYMYVMLETIVYWNNSGAKKYWSWPRIERVRINHEDRSDAASTEASTKNLAVFSRIGLQLDSSNHV